MALETNGRYACATLEPVADTSVYTDGRSVTTLSVFPDFAIAYLRFSLDEVPTDAQIHAVELRAHAFGGFASGGDGNCYTHFVADDTWGETGLTWADKPALAGSPTGYWWLFYGYENPKPPQTGRNADPGLVPLVQNELNGDGLLSLALRSPGYRYEFHSREASDPALRPALQITWATPDDSGSAAP
jgi:hypothetical protein